MPGATRVRVVHHEVQLASRGAGRPPLRVAFISDLHIGPTAPKGLLDNAFAELRQAKPDLLILGGDYVYLEASAERAAELKQRVASVSAGTKVGVLGNHDLWTDHRRLETALIEAGVRMLINDAIRLPAPYDDVSVLGLDDPWVGTPDAQGALAAAGDAPTKIAVCHSPDGAPSLQGRGVQLYVCGHTHGGQIALPGPLPILMPCRYGRRWTSGLHREDGLHLFVSRGLGSTGLPVRTFAPPDVAFFTLTWATESDASGPQ